VLIFAIELAPDSATLVRWPTPTPRQRCSAISTSHAGLRDGTDNMPDVDLTSWAAYCERLERSAAAFGASDHR
jgi:hypothetical protein